MRRVLTCLAAMMLYCLCGSAQVLSFIDGITRNTRLAQAGRTVVENPFTEFRQASPLPAIGHQSAAEDFEFISYLLGNGMEHDALILLSSDNYSDSDTLRFLRGWTNYSVKNLPEAVAEFNLVGPESPLYERSLFFNIVSDAHMKRFDSALEKLGSYSESSASGPYRELEALEKAGLALLTGSQAACLDAMTGFTYSSYTLTESEEMIRRIYEDRYCAHDSKSPAVAALMSCIIPGSGKIYAGETGAGAAALLGVGSMAAITAENWSRHGLTHWKTILSGVSAAALYIGNIYGSYISVSIHNNDIRNAQDTAVLYHIHIPLRSIFQ